MRIRNILFYAVGADDSVRPRKILRFCEICGAFASFPRFPPEFPETNIPV